MSAKYKFSGQIIFNDKTYKVSSKIKSLRQRTEKPLALLLAFLFTLASVELRFRLQALDEEDSKEDQKLALEPILLKEPPVLR